MPRASILAIVGLLLAADAAGETVVKKDGKRIEVKGAPVWKEGRVSFLLPDGKSGTLPAAEVDRAATERANAKGTATFTNEDLAKAKGLSDSGGAVKVEAAAADAPPAPERKPARDVVPAKLRTQVEPEFPPEATSTGAPSVTLAGTVDEGGRVVDPKVVSSTDPLLDEPALAAFSRWEYEPARDASGRAVPWHTEVTMTLTRKSSGPRVGEAPGAGEE